ncbi:E3 ubiquitin-protein ligase DZIP3 [Callorhinchus milii]|uniref:E3 ubiquitin-protein ligase DZIP3 n=1 Tax=Callorhinchus milii TaxID=7868 RepID=UPI001C3F86D5|nr:E3 ubiquitin-protein ligase DZIP3 [Callorhinchus milii]XP_007893993.2 E3 ubiquitin-protein ligase DZIP3 [Callorhinchus milii]
MDYEDNGKPDWLAIAMNEYVEKCKNLPDPIGICQYSNCKKEIYTSDPDYKGYVELLCDRGCVVKYHTSCWKKMKDSQYPGQTNRIFCVMKCLKIHCKGFIIKLVIHDAAGNTQTEFEVKLGDLLAQSPLVYRENEVKVMHVAEESSKENIDKGMEEKAVPSSSLTYKCRLFREVAVKRKLIENGIAEIQKTSEQLVHYIITEGGMEKGSECTAEIILDYVLSLNCNFKIRRFIVLLKNEDLGYRPELTQWINFILQLGNECSLSFVNNFKTIIIEILQKMETYLMIIAKKLLSQRLISTEDMKILIATPLKRRPGVLMGLMDDQTEHSHLGDLLFVMGEEQDKIPAYKHVFQMFNTGFDIFSPDILLFAAQNLKNKPIDLVESVVEDPHGISVAKTKTKSKKKRKKSKSKKAQANKDSENTAEEHITEKHEALSIPVQENQLNKNKDNQQEESSTVDALVSSVTAPESSSLPLATVIRNSNAGSSLRHLEVSKLDSCSDHTYQSDGELDDIDTTLTVNEPSDSSAYAHSRLYSSSEVESGAIKIQELIGQNVKEESEMKPTLISLKNEYEVLQKCEEVVYNPQKEQQKGDATEKQYRQLKEQYQLETMKIKQQLQSKEEEIKMIKAQFTNERVLWMKDKAKMEDVTAKNIAKLVETTKRAITAEVLILECHRDYGLFQLQQTEQDCSVQHRTAEENVARNPESAQICAKVDAWQAILADIRNKIDFTKNQFDDQINLVKNGAKLKNLPQIKIPPPPPPPDVVMKHFLEQHLQAKTSNVQNHGVRQAKPVNTPFSVAARTPEVSAAIQEQSQAIAPVSEQAPSQQLVQTGGGASLATMGARGKNSLERIMEKLLRSYPQFTRVSLTEFLKEVKHSNGGSLSGLSFDDMINKVARLVEAKLSESSNNRQNNPPQSVWRSLRQQGPVSWEGARTMTEEQEPCVICHEEFSSESILALPCAHKFHSQCIGPWLKEQRTCPTCRLHVVLPQEFPGLPHRNIPLP